MSVFELFVTSSVVPKLTKPCAKPRIVAIKKYLSNINIDERIESGAKKGELVHNPSTISKLGKELLGLQDSYEMAKKKVITEYREKMKMRGGGSMGALEND